ncbi:hypothetical protein PGTUg99_002623 [Puccinia graminis f. sp. tritici]|uniref:L-lactate dehydrogenase (cytochrome) n=1 Tax=Puccinia graminis f. sp. tritici TaxID=56615 RepID=A0A5B0RAE1_PUCGR|nr:hypothetical protein PGTUg99_002623 [Puccinia graminis f. sp. tritici]
MKELSAEEIKKHSNSSSYVKKKKQGGQAILLKYAGMDASDVYDPIHPPGTIEEYLDKQHHKGRVKETDLKMLQPDDSTKNKSKQGSSNDEADHVPSLSSCLSLYDFESIAVSRMTAQAWAYYSSGSDDEISLRENRAAFQRVWFRPRILRDVRRIDYSCELLGSTALGKLGHPEGEKNLTIAAGQEGIIQMIPTLASCAFEELVQARAESQNQWYQVYVNQDREKTKKLILKAERAGIKAFFITVDAPQLGRREKDMRLKFEDLGSDVQNKENEKVDRSQGATRAISSFIDASLSWDDIPWLRSITKLPILLKGVQSWEDAVMAKERGLQGIVLSNHGGRQLDYSRSGLEVLVEVVDKLRELGSWNPREFGVFMDGGVRRASDVLKALCLGATGVGLGRPFLYAYSVYGSQGVVRAIQILKDEMEMNMRLIGAPTLADLSPDMVDISALKNRVIDSTPDFKARQNYIPLPKITASKL